MRTAVILTLLLALGCGGKEEEDGAILRVDHYPSPRPRPTASPSPQPTIPTVSEAVVQALCSSPCGVEDSCLSYYRACLLVSDVVTCVEERVP